MAGGRDIPRLPGVQRLRSATVHTVELAGVKADMALKLPVG